MSRGSALQNQCLLNSRKDAMTTKLAIGTVVRFSDEWLARCTPDEVRRYKERSGVVSGYRAGANDPIVTFAKDGRRPEQKLFEVRANSLVVVPQS